MKKNLIFKFFPMFILTIFLFSCSQPPKVVKVYPQQENIKIQKSIEILKVKEGKKTQKINFNLKTALILPQGKIQSITQRRTGIGMLGLLGYYMKPELEKTELPHDFKENLIKSMEAVLLNKGYGVIGPFKSLDEMTYEEKKRTDFVIIPNIELYDEGKLGSCEMTKQPLSTGISGVALSKGEIQCTGQLRLKGQLSFEIREPLTSEKLYIKGIDFVTEPIKYGVIVEVPSNEQIQEAYKLAYSQLLEAYDSAKNKALSLAYEKFVKLFQKYMPEGEEAIGLKKQAEELKKEKRF